MVTDLQYLTGLNLPRCQQFLRFCCITCKNNAAVSRYNPHDQRAFICIAVSAADRRADDLYCSIAQGIICAALGIYKLRFGILQQCLYICLRLFLRQNEPAYRYIFSYCGRSSCMVVVSVA